MDAMERSYGARPTRDEAMEAGMRLLALMELLSTPPPSTYPQDDQHVL